jgi:Ca-activated chloride channel homolog
MHRRILGACLGVLALGVCAISQQSPATKAPPPTVSPERQQPPQPQPTKPQEPGGEVKFGANPTEVIVPVSVTDFRGKYVSNLEARDFRILDDGRSQRIRFFSHDPKQPVVVGFLLDISNSTRIHWKTFQDAVMEMVWALLPGDPNYTGYLITYSTQAELAVNTTQDSETITDRIRKLHPGGSSALFDAIYRACTDRKLVPGEPYEPRRVIVIIGDGHDTASKKSLGEVLELAQRNLVTIYAISTENFGFDNPDKDVLEKLAQDTGGRVEYPLDNLYKDVSGYLSHPTDEGNYALDPGTGGYAAEISKGIIKAVGGITGDITQQYVMRYIPDNVESDTNAYHHIKVTIPELPNVNIRAKSGYWAQPVPQVKK